MLKHLNVSYIGPTSMMVVSTLLPALSIIAVTLRFFVRRKQGAKLWWDDWLLIPALLLIIGIAIAQIYGVVHHALGYPKGVPASAPPEEELFYLSPRVKLFEQVQFATQLMHPLVLGFIKASFIVFYRRIFYVGRRNWFSVFTAFMLVFILVWSITFCLVFVLYCGNHVSAIWGEVIGIITHCPHSFQFQQAFAATDFIMDVIVILAPVPAILQLQLSWARKLSIMAIFMLGAIAIAASAVRMVIVIVAANIGFDVHLDGDIVVGAILFWSMIEDNVAIVAACLPTMRILFKHRSLDSMIRSVRSIISLHSLHSSSSNRDRDRGKEGDLDYTRDSRSLRGERGPSTEDGSAKPELDDVDDRYPDDFTEVHLHGANGIGRV